MQCVGKLSDVIAYQVLIQIKLNAIHDDLKYLLEYTLQMIVIFLQTLFED